MDEGEGITVDDFGAADATGVLVGRPQWAEGHIGGALEFNGVDQFVRMEDKEEHDLFEQMTLAAWIWVIAPATDAHPSILDKGNNYRLRLRSMTLRPSFAINNPASVDANMFDNVVCDTPDDIPLMEWHHVAATYDNDLEELRTYVDGVEECFLGTSGGGMPEFYGGDLSIGRWTSGGTYFNGRIDDVRLYDVVLTAEEIAALAEM